MWIDPSAVRGPAETCHTEGRTTDTMTTDQTADTFDTSGWTREQHHEAACIMRARIQDHETAVEMIADDLAAQPAAPRCARLEAWLAYHDTMVGVLGWQGVISAILATREQ